MNGDRLTELEAELRALTDWRREFIANCRQSIIWANQVFDMQVVPIQREINQLREDRAALAKVRPNPRGPQGNWRSPTADVGSDEDLAHLLELRAKFRTR